MKSNKNGSNFIRNKVLKKEFKGFSKGEEIFNAVSHIVGGAFAIIVTIWGVTAGAIHHNAFAVVAMAIYGASMLLVYTSSSIYHFLRRNRAKKLFRVFDHCMIFLLIAGTYTPYCLILLRNEWIWGWGLFILQWALAILGIVFNAINMHSKTVKRLSMLAYLAMGWAAVVAIVPISRVLSTPGLMWTLAGGISYTVGAVFYACGRRAKYIHSVWHLFVLAGSILQFVAIAVYVI
jgi:hemolysin III